MARALIVGCGCRGRMLGERLLAAEWAVRGTSRRENGLGGIEAAGIEAALADPSRPGTVLEMVGDVAVVVWLLGSAQGDADAVAAIHGELLERMLERLVDTPVRGFVYEAAGSIPADALRRGSESVEAAAARWRIPVRVVGVDPADHSRWTEAMLDASLGVAGRPAGDAR